MARSTTRSSVRPPIIFKVIGNIIMKAVTALLALLSGAFSGGDESGAVNFAPGSAKLDGKAREQLAKIVKALNDRPALKMTVVGESREAEDKEAWKTEELDRLLLAQKRRNVIREGKSGDEVMEFSDAERPALLKAVYVPTSKAPQHGRNGQGSACRPDDGAAGGQHQGAFNDAMRELALARGVAVRTICPRNNCRWSACSWAPQAGCAGQGTGRHVPS